MIKWHVEKRKLRDLIPYKFNPRFMSQKQYKNLSKSLFKFGLVELPVINTDNIIIAGHQRCAVLKDIKGDDYEISVIIPDRKISEKDFKEYNIRSNKNTGSWDFDMLGNNFEMDELEDWGFSEEELLNIDFDDNVGSCDENELPEINENEESIIKQGDLIELGKHKLLCGDSTKEEDVKRLMNGESADICFTDPDYAMDDDNWIDCLQKYGIKKGNPIFIMASDKQQVRYVQKIQNFRKFFAGIRNQAVMISESVPMNKLTLISYFGETPAKFFINKKDYFTDVFEFKRNASENEREIGHRHYKSVEVPKLFLEHYAKRNALVVDLFGGSGTTMIASEMLKMKCYVCEISPLFCQLIIERYCNYIGKDNIKINGEKVKWNNFKEE